MKRVKVLWISDFSTKHNIGGAQRSDAIIIDAGKSLGFDITHFTFDSDVKLLSQTYDHLVSANLNIIAGQNPAIIDYITRHPSHSRLEHDMNRYLSTFDRQRLFLSCQNTFFLTEYHHELFKKHYGNFFQNVRIVSDPIDTNLFKDLGRPREDKILYVGFMHELKGTYDFFTYVAESPDKQFVVAAWGDKLFEHLARTLPNITFLGAVDYSKMPEVYNQYSVMMYLPRMDEPFCRSVGEALLCGMELMVNNKIGCVHEYNRVGADTFIKNCQEAPAQFWNYITN